MQTPCGELKVTLDGVECPVLESRIEVSPKDQRLQFFDISFVYVPYVPLEFHIRLAVPRDNTEGNAYRRAS